MLLFNIFEATITDLSLIDSNNSYTFVYILDAISSLIIIICTNLPKSAYINVSSCNSYVWPLDTEWCILFTIWNFIFGFNRTCLNNFILWINALIVPLLFMITRINFLPFWKTEKGDWSQNRTIALAFKKMAELVPIIGNYLPFWDFKVCDKDNLTDTDIAFVYILNILSFTFGVCLLYKQYQKVIYIERENEAQLLDASNGSKYELSVYQLIIVKIKGIVIRESAARDIENGGCFLKVPSCWYRKCDRILM